MEDVKLSQIKQKDLLERLERMFSNATAWDRTWRDNAEVWYEYYHGIQWSSEEVEALQSRGQAVTTYNHIKPAIDSLIGSERQNRPKVTMAGRELSDQQLAEVKTKLYDFIQYQSNTDDELDKMVLDAMVTGRGWMYIYPDTAGEYAEVKHSYIDYRDMFIDSLSRKDNLSDARDVHYAKFTDSDIIKEQFPKFISDDVIGYVSGFESSSDDNAIWYQGKDRKRPRLINSWFRDEKGDVHTVVWVKGQILYYKKNPYTASVYPFVQFTVNRDMENKPYGLVKGMISAQDEVNKRHSKALHYLNAKQVLAEEDAFVDWSEAVKTLAKPDGVTKLVDGALSQGKVQVLDNTALATTHIQLMDVAKSNILASAGINAAYVGQSSQYESAKKANISIAQAQNSVVPMLNKLRIARYELANITMKLVPDFYVEERIIRILEPNGKYAFMSLNQISMLDNGTLAKLNDVTSDDVDIVIEDAPRGLNEREEQFAQLLQIQGQTSRPIPMEVLLRYSSIKDKHQLAEDIKAFYDLQGQLQQQQQMIEQLQQALQQAGGQQKQMQNQIVQERTARQVEKEVNKQKEKGGMTYGLF